MVTTLPGEVRPNLDRVAHIAARFPGIVGSVRKSLGDQVRAGEVLATIESEQLSTYELRAAFDGTIIEKDVAPGEVITQDRAAFVLANLSTVWVTIRVFQEALPFVRVGQAVLVTTAEGGPEAEGRLSYLSPVVEGPARTATARVVLPNEDGTWRPGLFVTADLLDPVGVPLAIERRAIQTFEGKPAVFVVDGEEFVPREVSLGRAGRTRVEVLAGLSPGERYADTRSFLVKAELGKGEAEEEE
jgi:cobalt-zinc-cadmium efflux system membrane fusion protein